MDQTDQLWDRIRFAEEELDNTQTQLHEAHQGILDHVRSLLLQISNPRTPNEWYALLGAFNLLKSLGLNDAKDDTEMEVRRKSWEKNRLRS